jgi:hypothetical protein
MPHDLTPPHWQALNPRPQPPPHPPAPPFSPETRARLAAPPYTPGFERYTEQRFDFVRHQIKQHARLGASRAHAALLLALADISLVALALGLYFWVVTHIAAPLWILRWFLLFCTLVGFFCLLVALFIALRAALWRRGSGAAGGQNALFFHSGEATPLPNPQQFNQDFQHATRQNLLEAAVSEMYAYARFRQRQEARLRMASILTLAALVFIWICLILALFVI